MPLAESAALSRPERLEKLVQLCLLDATTDPAFDRLTSLAARILHTPTALVSIVEPNRQFYKSFVGLSPELAAKRESPISHSFCQHVVTTEDPLIIHNATEHPLVYDNPAIHDYGAMAYAGMPLKTADGIVLGSFCVIDYQPRVWTDEEIAILRDLAQSVMTELELRDQLHERTVVEAELRKVNDQLHIVRRLDMEIMQSLDIRHVLTFAMDIALRITRADHGIIALCENNQLRVVYGVGEAYQTDTLIDETGIVARVMHNRAPELVCNVSADPDYVPYVPTTTAQMTLPLVSREEVFGVLSLETQVPSRFNDENFEQLKRMIRQISSAVANARLFELTQRQFSELKTAHERVSQLEQLKTDMIRIAAHDLRNPLGIVVGYSDMLIEDSHRLTADQLEFVERISASAARMEKIVRDILSLERFEQPSDLQQVLPFDLRELVGQVFKENAPHAAEKGVQAELTLPGAAVYVQGDLPQLREAIENLINNAIKYTPAGGVIQVALSYANERARVEVRDTGYGIPDAMQERLFQPFYRAKTVETGAIEGTGLGLHLVKNIIERHNGKMHFTSVYGKGSVFGFTLPVLKHELEN